MQVVQTHEQKKTLQKYITLVPLAVAQSPVSVADVVQVEHASSSIIGMMRGKAAR